MQKAIGAMYNDRNMKGHDTKEKMKRLCSFVSLCLNLFIQYDSIIQIYTHTFVLNFR